MPSNEFVLGLVQMRCSTDPAANLEKAVGQIHAAAKGARSSACRSCSARQYFCQTEDPALFDLAEPIPGPTTERLARRREGAGVVVVGSLFERRAAGMYHNTAVVLDADGTAARACTARCTSRDDPLYFEKYYFTPGDLGFKVLRHAVRKVGTLVCWDQWYPEAARLTALQGRRGARSTRRPSAGTRREKAEFGEAQHDAWETIQRGHAIANGVYVGGRQPGRATRAPAGGGLEFWGARSSPTRSAGSSPAGARPTRRCWSSATATRELEDVRRNWPFFRDRRIDAYADLVKVGGDEPANE